MLIAALYNMVDQIFIGHGVGYLGNGATNVVYPVTVLTLALSIMVCAYLSICQGKEDVESARKSMGNAVTVMILVSLILTAVFAVLNNLFSIY